MVEEDRINPDDIFRFYQEGIVKDRLRIYFYVSIKLYEWAGFCLEKRNIYIQEMKENEFPI